MQAKAIAPLGEDAAEQQRIKDAFASPACRVIVLSAPDCHWVNIKRLQPQPLR
ncbi:hypothetical protein LT85_3129 [Collimonas arenae]|uniref:Uncharacterized protein n=1 Tax=Collimonas arenae TaxID=279058 RepID=A0A0A1FHF3_9BURK|nr:hypothetical protein LT85_3129 [Collimonas arenae]